MESKLTVLLNPANYVEEYIRAADEAFGPWGGRAMYDWVFREKIGDVPSDRFVFTENDQLVAGTALVYRPVKTERGGRLSAAIIVGSFTIPSHRGRGIFSQMAELTQERAASRGAAVYLGFAAAQNKSVSRLLEAGCATHPSWYYKTDFSKQAPPAECPFTLRECRRQPGLRRAYNLRAEKIKGKNHFDYSFEEWTLQMLKRPTPSLLYWIEKNGNELGYFILTAIGRKRRLVEFFAARAESEPALVDAAIFRAAQGGNEFDCFALNEPSAKIFESRGLELTPGVFIFAGLDDAARAMGMENWLLHSGDRM